MIGPRPESTVTNAVGSCVTTFVTVGIRFFAKFTIVVERAFSDGAISSPSAILPSTFFSVDLTAPIDPESVSSDSLAKFPAYCSVRSKNICIASCAFSALLAVFQSKLMPFSSA